MLFSSLTFIFYFLPLCIVSYYIIPRKFIKLRNTILLIFSLIFYAWGEPKYIFLMLLTVLISYIFGLLINYYENKKNKKMKQLTFIISIILIISSLIFFKYTNFIFNNINKLFSLNISIKNIVLPIGISFYTFQILSYNIDLYRKKIKVQKNYFNLALYISFFPQLIAGPIVTYETIEEQLENRTHSFDKFVNGFERFIIGLGKKIIIANHMALIADKVFNSEVLGEYNFIIILLATISYSLQIYFDFSGYSDMAIGLGKIFGFDFLENFNYPYMSKNITDFWRRWHISLTTFFREYVYIPLGGNRVKKSRWIFNLFVVWLLTGVWHGAAWNFILWGLYYFVLLLIEKNFFNKFLNRIPQPIYYLITIILINIGWILFRVNNLNDLLIMFDFQNSIDLNAFIFENTDIIISVLLLPFGILLSTNIINRIDNKYNDKQIYRWLKVFMLIVIFIVCIMFLVSSLYNPFIYFRF